MRDRVYYHGGEIEVKLGDLVRTRVLWFWRSEGRVVYVPGISSPHPEMEFGCLSYVGIRTVDSGMIGITVIPETSTIRKSVKFIARNTGNDIDAVHPDDHLFEDSEGKPL